MVDTVDLKKVLDGVDFTGWFSDLSVVTVKIHGWDTAPHLAGCDIPECAVDDASLPWFGEPSFFQVTLADGFVLSVLRAQRGHLCGYVSFPKGSEPEDGGLDTEGFKVHGGITYEQVMEEAGGLYTLGFDCAHSRDGGFVLANPQYKTVLKTYRTYRNFTYVLADVVALYRQMLRLECYTVTRWRVRAE